MKSMFAPVKDKPAVERLEPLSDVSPGLLLQSSPSGMLLKIGRKKMFCLPSLIKILSQRLGSMYERDHFKDITIV